jgi:YVTN family beta-propeller protein
MPDAIASTAPELQSPGFRGPRTLVLSFLLATLLGPLVPDPLVARVLASDQASARRLRRPAALAMSPDGSSLFVANSRSGSVSVVEPSAQRVVAEYDVGRSLADIKILPDGRHLLAVDPGADELLVLETSGGSIRIAARQSVAPHPEALVVAPDGRWCVTASRWSRRLTFLALETAEPDGPMELSERWVLELPFSPLNMVLVRGSAWLIVADAFGGRLAAVDATSAKLEVVRTVAGAHNIRGLALAPDGRRLVLAHQALHRLARTTFEDVHWGSLLTNHLTVVDVEQVLTAGAGSGDDRLRGTRQIDLGEPGNGAGDPSVVTFAPSGQLVTALAGVDEMRIGPEPGKLPMRTAVGRRPAAIALRPDGLTAYVANSLDDTLSIVDLPSGLVRSTISLGPTPPLSAVERGERLFFDARLAHDAWMSCHSCHTDGQTSGRTADTLGDGGFGAPKRIPSLLGVGATGPWGWLGGFTALEDQVRQSIASTMQGPEPGAATVADLVAYLTSLGPPEPAQDMGDPGEVARGRAVFLDHGCTECHAAPQFTTPKLYDVGLPDEVGHRRFNPPSLRGVGRREPLLHDGRAATLEDVFRVEHHPRDLTLPPGAMADLLAYLRTL